MKVLLVDDDRELLDLLGFALRRAGLEPIVAYDGASALSVFEERRPDLLVLDINIAASRGPDLLRELRRRRAAVPVIIFATAHAEAATVQALELGADDWITKPLSHRELIARIRAQLRRRRGSGGEPEIGAGRTAPLKPRGPTRWATAAAEPPTDATALC
jgi:DNA-binding response OmpR family regulator